MKTKLLGLVLICFILTANVLAQSTAEYDVKAVFLLKIIDFVEWSKKSNTIIEKSPISLCVLGKNPFGEYIQDQGDTLSIRYEEKVETTKGCHVVFISRSEIKNLKSILNFLGNKPILSISDINNFAKQQGMMELAIQSSRINILINLNATHKSGIKLNSNLIELATLVDAEDELN